MKNVSFIVGAFCTALLSISANAQISQAVQKPRTIISAQSMETITPLVELYTSEGCSSCPRADQWFGKFGEALNSEFHAIPLAFHVDYWNRLGWEDEFSRPQFTNRQKEIVARNQLSGLYTPQFVASGKDTRGGADVIDSVFIANATPSKIIMDLAITKTNPSRISASVSIRDAAGNVAPRDTAELFLAIYENDLENVILSGENRGETLHHDFVVRYWSPLKLISPHTENLTQLVDIEIEKGWVTDNLGFAAVVVDKKSGETLQAVRSSLKGLFQKS